MQPNREFKPPTMADKIFVLRSPAPPASEDQDKTTAAFESALESIDEAWQTADSARDAAATATAEVERLRKILNDPRSQCTKWHGHRCVHCGEQY